MHDSSVILKARGVAKILGEGRRDPSFRLGPIDLDARAGEILAVVGTSGAGKSTLLSVLSGITPPDSGSVLLQWGGQGIVISPAAGGSWRRARLHLGFVHQDPSGSLNPRRSIVDQVADPLRIHGLCPRREAIKRAAEDLEVFGISSKLAPRYPSQLSVGQRQRVAIARAMVHRPAVLFLDEPTSSLDPSVQAEVLQVLRNLRGPGVAIVLVTHDLAVVRSLADRIAVVSEGRIVEVGDAEPSFESPRSVQLRKLLAASFF